MSILSGDTKQKPSSFPSPVYLLVSLYTSFALITFIDSKNHYLISLVIGINLCES